MIPFQLDPIQRPTMNLAMTVNGPIATEAQERTYQGVRAYLKGKEITPSVLLLIVHGVQREVMDPDLKYAIRQAEDISRRKPGCIAGCNHCCYQFVYASTTELAILALGIDDNLKATIHGDLVDSITKTEGLDHAQRYQKGIPCVFLKEGQCAIYPFRPESCRGYFSMSRYACQKDFSHRANPGYSKGVPILASAQFLTGGHQIGLDLALAEHRLEITKVELTRGMKRMLEVTPEAWLKGNTGFFKDIDYRPSTGSYADMIQLLKKKG